MKKLFVVTVLIIFISNADSQTKNPAIGKFKLSLSQGLTYNFDDNIVIKGETLDHLVYHYTVNMTNFEAGYFFSKHHEAGLSIGKNSFTVPQEYVYSIGISFPGNDTTLLTTLGKKYIDMTWFALYYNFHFLDSYKAGIKFGSLKPTLFENAYSDYLNLSLGKYYMITYNFMLDVTLNYSNRSRDFKYFKSNQLSLSLGFNLRI